jgi:CheY-like chemotaxis protein
VKIQAQQKNLEFDWTYSDLIHDFVIGDELRYSQIITNLLNNALKFTDQGKLSLEVSLGKKEATIQTLFIKIKDTGIGIPEEKIPYIFEKFKQGDDSISRAYGGCGLGLFIVKEIIDKMKGTIEVSSQVNKYTEFKVCIPFMIDDKRVDNDINNETANIKGVKILLAEDNAINVLYIKSVLTKRGAIVDVAEDGKVAIERCKQNSYDLILMDLQMPVMDGLTATSIIRNELKILTPIITQSANTVENQIQQCYELGVNDYLAKPFKPDQLLSKVATNLTRSTSFSPAVESQNGEIKNIYQQLLSLVEGDEQLAQTMLKVYQEEIYKDLALIEEHISRNELLSTNQLAHKLKSTFQYLDMPLAVNICLFLEKIHDLNDNNREKVLNKLLKLRNLVDASLKI